MESNFYQKIIPIENEEKRALLDKMSKLLDESIEDLIKLRQRKNNELNYINIKLMDIYNEFHLFQRVPLNNNSNNNNRDNTTRVQDSFVSNRAARLRRIRNMEEETEDLYRLVENDNNVEVIG